LKRFRKRFRTASPVINEYKYSWYYPPLQVDGCHPTYNLRLLDSAAARHGLPTKLMKGKPMGLILLIVLLLVLFGGGFGFYRGGYYRQGGPVGIGGVLGLILVVLVIGWLFYGHVGGLTL
jgi:hypothetical protein